MRGFLDLNGTWELYYNDDFPRFLTAETVPGRHFYRAMVPASVQETLMEAGVLEDPRFGLNSLRARWVEETYWAYRRTFTLPEGYITGTPAWLCLDQLEMNAVVYLNGEEIGRHANAHRPARFVITGKLRAEGENVITVLLESGLFENADKPGAEYRDSPQARLTKIHWNRRGQWQRGWDWQQRLLNVGILGDVRLEWSDTPIVEQLQVYATVTEDLQKATLHAWCTVINPTADPVEITLSLKVAEADAVFQKQVAIAPGTSRHYITFEIEKPRLWHPIGQGEQYRYEVVFTFQHHEEINIFTRHVGIRRVEVDQSEHPEEGRYFILKVNNEPVFCKGGNWVPADMLHSTVTPERYRELVDLAIGANFNMLRIWGGGIFASPELLDYCDETGMMVWHDLLFACSKYPGDHPDFAREVGAEVTWAVREMAHHASLVVWCGNNEIEEGDWHWGWQQSYRVTPHYALFHRDLPRIVTHEDPSKFYWISSPYSPDYKSPRDPTVGDQHPWKVSLQMPGGADWWEYRTMVDRYPNEGGVLGASSPATLRQFLPEGERYLLSPSWEHHDNPFAINDITPGSLGHAYQTVQLWTGLDPMTMDWERYAFVSALLQAEGLTEYIANFRRRMFSSASAIFWMYNDSWPATHGWTIVDYYRRKKLAYHPVRRAFHPVGVVAANEGDELFVAVVNDTTEVFEGTLTYGWFDTMEETDYAPSLISVRVPAGTVQRIPIQPGLRALEEQGKERTGIFASLYDKAVEPVVQHRAFFARFGELTLERAPEIRTKLQNGVLTLNSEVFCWGVCLDVDGELPLADNCFDLIPGISYALPWDSATLGEPRIVRLGNRDAF
jgi:beta-mannosidase